MAVTVIPESFSLVHFDAERIAGAVGEAAALAGIDADVTVEVEERIPLGQVRVVSVDPVSLHVEGGAFEDPKRPRQLSERRVLDVCGLLLFQVADRLDPDFGAPPLDQELPLTHRVAWDTYAVGRLARRGQPVQRQRRVYHFRNRHGFTDAADAAFERIWNADHLDWAQLTEISDRATALREAIG